ncbi:MAG TPA: enoyl-CoA hydratase/isomerase family protein, partial [Candidatus Eisenbacteria bacterium]|jgi:cyclohexa-1,5-dienecarbonyl-CoA hydratase
MSATATVRYEVKGRIARLTLDRPPLHILSIPMMKDLSETVASVEREESVVVAILDATGDKAFSAGVDIKDHTPEKAPEMLEQFHAVIRRIRGLPCLTLAAVRGVALGGGFELALACDMIVAEEGASFGVPEIWLACFPPVAAAVLPHHIAPQKAYEIILSGEPITASEAAQMGFVNAVAPKGRLEPTLEQFVSRFAEKSAAALRITKRALRISEESTFDPALRRIERIYLQDLMRTRDAEEGIRAYLEKREPRWQDR